MVVPHRYVVARPGWNATLQVIVVVGLVVLVVVVMMMVVVVVVVVNIMVMAMMVGANITNTKAFQHFVTLAQEKFCDIQYMTQHKYEIRGQTGREVALQIMLISWVGVGG